MRFGIWVLNVFAAAFGMAALAGLAASPWTWPTPLLVSAGVIVFCSRFAAAPNAPSPEEAGRTNRLVALWSTVEAVAILIAVIALQRVGAARLIGPAIALIVGLHFLPLARGLPLRAYYATGAALIVVSVAAMLLPGGYPLPAAGAGAALVLWITSLAIAFRPAPRVESASTPS
ncbi:MAG: hypothetical protein ACHP84_05945 [Caulobacterales bacterium]